MTGTDKGNVLDKVLSQLNVFGCYHSVYMFWTFLALASNSVYCSNFIFVAEEVGYRCADDTFGNNTCTGLNTTEECAEWIYDNPHSFVAEFGLACQEWKRTLIGTVHSLGYMVGLLLMGPMSDSDPTPETSELLSVKWTPVTKDVMSYLRIDSKLSLQSRPFNQRMAFWELFYNLNVKSQRLFTNSRSEYP